MNLLKWACVLIMYILEYYEGFYHIRQGGQGQQQKAVGAGDTDSCRQAQLSQQGIASQS